MKPLTGEQIAALADAMPERYAITIWLATFSGMRLGEVLGFTTDRITWLPKGSIRVDRQLQGRELVACKTRASVRTIPVDKMIVDMLADHLRRWPSDGLLITSKVGRPVLRAPFGACFRKAAKQAGLEGVHYHDLRHTYASLLIRAGVNPLVVAARLGHKDVAMTLNIYSHLFDDDRLDAGRGAVEAAFAENLHATLHAGER